MAAPTPSYIVRTCFNGWQYDRPAYSEQELGRIVYVEQRRRRGKPRGTGADSFTPLVLVYQLVRVNPT